MQTKHCKRCGRDLPLSKFNKHKNTKDGLTFYCRDCISEKGKKYRKTVSGIWNNIKGRQKHYHRRNHQYAKPISITKDEFVEWYINEPKVCAYCGLPEILLIETYDTHNDKVSRHCIDCMDNDLGYVKGNLVIACNRCNNIKKDFLTYEEMRYIGQNMVKLRWEKQLGKKL